MHEVSSEVWKALKLAFRKAILDRNILTIVVAKDLL
jgi:hypothetical protein